MKRKNTFRTRSITKDNFLQKLCRVLFLLLHNLTNSHEYYLTCSRQCKTFKGTLYYHLLLNFRSGLKSLHSSQPHFPQLLHLIDAFLLLAFVGVVDISVSFGNAVIILNVFFLFVVVVAKKILKFKRGLTNNQFLLISDFSSNNV